MKRFFFLLGGLVLGLLAGRFYYSASTNNVELEASTVSAPLSLQDVKSQNLAQSQKAITDTVFSEEKASSVIRHLKALAELKAVRKDYFSAPLETSDGIDPDFSKLYGLSADETRQLQAQLLYVKTKMAELEVTHAKIEPAGNDTVSITVSPFPAEGAAVYDQLLGTISGILGPERYAYFKELTLPSVENIQGTNQFGLTSSTYMIKVNETLNMVTMHEKVDPTTSLRTRVQMEDLASLKSHSPMLYQKLIDLNLGPKSSVQSTPPSS